MVYHGCKNSRIMCWKLKHCDIRCSYFLKHNGLCWRLADSNYFYTGINTAHKFSCMSNAVCMHVTYSVIVFSFRKFCSKQKNNKKQHCSSLQFLPAFSNYYYPYEMNVVFTYSAKKLMLMPNDCSYIFTNVWAEQ